ncbi:histidine kinase [Salmonirosea aquatica]
MRKLVSACLLILLFTPILVAQPVPTLRLSDIKNDTSLIGLALWRITAQPPFPNDTLAVSTFHTFGGGQESGRDSVYWARFDVLNDTPYPQRRIFDSPAQNDVVHFYISPDRFRTVRHERVGRFVSYWEVAYRYSNYLLPVDFSPGQTLSFLIRIDNRYALFSDPNVRFITEQSLKDSFWESYSSNFNGAYLSVLVLGAVLAIFLFVAFLFITTRDSLYLYYGLYLGGVALYFTLKTDSLFFMGYWVDGFPITVSLINEPLQLIYTALYIRFSMGLLRIREHDPHLDRFLNISWKGLIDYAFLVLLVSAVIWKREFEQNLLIFDRVVLLVFNVAMLVRILQKNRSPLLTYFLIGNVFFITGVVLSTVTSLGLIDREVYATLSPINFFQIGVLCEIMCFSFALGYNVRLLERERNNNQRAYIDQLRVNQDISEKANRELTEKLDERTREVMAMSEAMQVQKEAHLRSEFEFQLSEMEMQALRAQMNPHFIFNSLNTIRYFVLNNENDKASDYLGKFARLLRMVLQNSSENTIPLSEELEALRLYLEIEARRFGESFGYEIRVPEDFDTDGLQVPPLLLQPFAENAIWHGLLHSPNPDKQLTVRVSEEKDFCLFVIEDNGIGRQKARQMKSRSAHVKKSFGMQITSKRVELFNKNFSSQIQIAVNDVVGPDGEVAGTSVEIRYQLPE